MILEVCTLQRMHLHALRLAPLVVPATGPQWMHVLREPVLVSDLVRDAAGTPYAFDLVVTNGAYVLFAGAVLWKLLRDALSA